MIDRLIVCTKENPWDRKPGDERVRHPDAYEVGEQESGWPSGDIVTYLCPHCGQRFKVELPQ